MIPEEELKEIIKLMTIEGWVLRVETECEHKRTIPCTALRHGMRFRMRGGGDKDWFVITEEGDHLDGKAIDNVRRNKWHAKSEAQGTELLFCFDLLICLDCSKTEFDERDVMELTPKTHE